MRRTQIAVMGAVPYRLYDIDVLIDRTLVYGSLTALLALIYFGRVFAIQYLLQGIINQNKDVSIIDSTLVIYVLFQPLRLGILIVSLVPLPAKTDLHTILYVVRLRLTHGQR